MVFSFWFAFFLYFALGSSSVISVWGLKRYFKGHEQCSLLRFGMFWYVLASTFSRLVHTSICTTAEH